MISVGEWMQYVACVISPCVCLLYLRLWTMTSPYRCTVAQSWRVYLWKRWVHVFPEEERSWELAQEEGSNSHFLHWTERRPHYWGRWVKLHTKLCKQRLIINQQYFEVITWNTEILLVWLEQLLNKLNMFLSNPWMVLRIWCLTWIICKLSG